MQSVLATLYFNGTLVARLQENSCGGLTAIRVIKICVITITLL